jgi:6-pyruvoyltetrahydropterin/6-carboxytetrahydropterin synthase
MITAERYHDISTGHRVYGHESKCAHLHGHNYRIHFKVCGDLDSIGRVIDFSVIKSKLCMWLEDNYDHKFLIYDKDPLKDILYQNDPEGVVIVPYNPTAENIAKWLVEIIGPKQLLGTGCELIEVKIEETAKCSATYNKFTNK